MYKMGTTAREDGEKAALQRTFQKIASGEINSPDHFGQTVRAAVRTGLTTLTDVAEIMNVQKQHVYKTADSMKPKEIARLCTSLNLV